MKTKDCCTTKEIYSLTPLYVLFTFIIIASIGLSFIFPIQTFMMYLMGIWFLSFGVLKLFDLRGFIMSFSQYDFIAKRWRSYGYLYPFIEIILWILYIVDTSMILMYPISIIALIISVLWFIWAYTALSEGKSMACACMGTLWKLPMTKVTVLENAIMILMIFAMILFPSLMMPMSAHEGMANMNMGDSPIMSEMMEETQGEKSDNAMKEHCESMPNMWWCEAYR